MHTDETDLIERRNSSYKTEIVSCKIPEETRQGAMQLAVEKKKLEKEKLAFSKKRNSSSVVTGGKAERIGTDAGRFVDSVIGRWAVLT